MAPPPDPRLSVNPTPGTIPLPAPVERLSARAAKLPWWVIILVFGLIVALYGIATTDIYKRALTFVTGNPQLITSDFLGVTYRVNFNGKVDRVLGTLVDQQGTKLKVRVVDPEYMTINKNFIGKLDRVPQPCAPDAPLDCKPRTLVTISVDARTIEGDFYTESATEYRVRLPNGEIVPALKTETRATRKLTPADCTPDINGSCQISLTIPPSVIKGELVNEAGDSYRIQTVDPQFVSFERSQITEVIRERAGVCALNNIGSCQDGIFLTAFLALFSYVLAVVLGLVLALMRISANPILRNVATLYVEVVRGIPILVILFIFYFGIGPAIRDNFGIPQPEWFRAALGLAIAYASFLAEIFRAGIQSISRGQMEAARSLGMNYSQSMRFVILPQAIRVVLPPLGNDFIAILKDTSLVAAISLGEMSYLAQQLNGQTLRPFPAFITLAVVYLIMTLLLSFFVRTIEHRVKLPG